MDFLELALARRSIRRYTDQDIPQETVMKLLAAAQSAPSAGNRQPWHFYAIANKAIQAEIMEKSYRQAFMLAAPLMIVVCADASRNADRYGERGENLYCIQDTAAAIENILLCATSLGLGACWCGAFDEDAVSETLNMPKNHRPIAVIPVGWPTDEQPGRTGRRPIEEIVTFIGESGNDH